MLGKLTGYSFLKLRCNSFWKKCYSRISEKNFLPIKISLESTFSRENFPIKVITRKIISFRALKLPNTITRNYL